MKKILVNCIGICIIGIFFAIACMMQQSVSVDEAEQTEEMVFASVVRYYASEGEYPGTVEELESYGLRYDKDRFIVGYQNIGGNIFPDVTIIDREGME